MDKNIAVLDIGTNSVMLLHAHCASGGVIDIVNEFGAITRLGEGVDKSKRLSGEAMRRTLDAIQEMIGIARSEGAEQILATATSAVREAINKTEFLVSCQQRFNVFPQVLSGKEEALFTYKGAIADFLDKDRLLLAIDVGGGSTEISYGANQLMVEAQSIDIGCVRLTEFFNARSTILDKIRNSMGSHITNAAAPVMEKFTKWLAGRTPTIICSGGTATTYAAVIQGMSSYDRAQINKTQSTWKQAAETAKKLGKLAIEERKKLMGMDPERAGVFPTGLTILSTIVRLAGEEPFYVTTNGLRMGMLRYYLEKNII